MKSIRRAASAAVAAVAIIVAAAPRAAGQMRLSLDQAVAAALRANPLMAERSAMVEAAQGSRIQAGALPNPKFIFQSENTRLGWGNQPFSYWNDTDNYLYLTQPIEVAGKRSSRIQAAAAGIKLSQSEHRLARRQLEGRVSYWYWNTLAASRVHDLLAQDLQTIEKIVQYHRDRVREGAMPEADLIRVELERDRLVMTVRSAGIEAERARIALLREMGRADFPAVVLTDSLRNLRAVEGANLDYALQRRPEIAAAKAALAQAEANLRLQQGYRVPDPSLVGGYKRTAGLDTIVFGVQIDLPFFNRNQGQVVAARAQVKAARAAFERTRLELRAELETALEDYRRRRAMVLKTPRPMLARAVETAQIAQSTYLEGGADLLRLLDAERARIETEVLYYRTLADYQQSVSNLRLALGMTP